ncbi:hypothetical protein pdam_00017747, partial [Pocillopora damicornis]
MKTQEAFNEVFMLALPKGQSFASTKEIYQVVNTCHHWIASEVGILYDKTEMGRDLTLKYISDNLCPPKEHSAPLILHHRAMDKLTAFNSTD